MCSAVSVFIETNDLIKFSLDLNVRGRRPLGFFPFFSIEIQAAILEIGELSLEFHEQLQRNLRAHWIGYGDGSQGRRSKTTFHITQSPAGLRWIVFDDLLNHVNYYFR